MGYVVIDAHGEVVFGLEAQHVVEHGLGHARREILGAQTVAAAHDGGRFALFEEGGADILVEGLAQGAAFLGAVQHGKAGHAGRDGAQQMLGREGTVEAHFHKARALALFVQVVDRLFNDLTGRAHADDHAVGFRMAHVVEEVVLAARDGLHLLHVFHHNAGHGIVVEVGGLAVLEVNVRILGGAAHVRVFGIHGGGAEFGHLVPVHQVLDVFVVDDFDLLHFMGGAEAVEEVAERQAGVDGRKMGHQGHVHALLHRGGAEEGEAGLAGGHDVLMVAEDGQGVGGQGACRHMEDAGQQLARDPVHVGDHQQQALRGRVGGGQRTTGQLAVHNARGARFGLHFTHDDRLAQHVLPAAGGHFIHDLAHDRRRRDGVNGRRLRQGIGNMCCGVIAVHGFHFSHLFLLGAVWARNVFSVSSGPSVTARYGAIVVKPEKMPRGRLNRPADSAGGPLPSIKKPGKPPSIRDGTVYPIRVCPSIRTITGLGVAAAYPGNPSVFTRCQQP